MFKPTPTPGLIEVVPNISSGYAAKITGHNLGAITYQVSLNAEAVGEETEIYIKFNSDGSLQNVSIDGQDTKPGLFMLLCNNYKNLVLCSEEQLLRDWKFKN